MAQYTLPDGRVIKLGPERFQAPEVMFSPRLLDMEVPGVAEMAFNAIQVGPRRCCVHMYVRKTALAWDRACKADML